jgi:hypothetical protein
MLFGMPKRQKEAHIAFASIHLGDKPEIGEQLPFGGKRKALLESLVPGTTVTRYNRTWHMARHEEERDFVTGRIGFDVAAAPSWDDRLNDFVDTRPGVVTPFAIDLRKMRVSFRLQGGAIKPWTFQGNFEALLNAAPSPHYWTVRLEGVEQPPWEEWRGGIDRITQITAAMIRPNPHYPSEEIERLFEDAKLAAVTLAARGDNIEPEGGILKEAIAHVLDGYGKLRAKGVRIEGGQAHEENWRTEAGAVVHQIVTALDPETHDLPPDALQKALEEDAGGESG